MFKNLKKADNVKEQSLKEIQEADQYTEGDDCELVPSGVSLKQLLLNLTGNDVDHSNIRRSYAVEKNEIKSAVKLTCGRCKFRNTDNNMCEKHKITVMTNTLACEFYGAYCSA